MITIFRKLRKGFLEQKRITKYAVYALGEILLVVIGILIAVAINNHLSENKRIAQEKIHLVNIEQDLIRIQDMLQSDEIKLRHQVVTNCKKMLDIIHSNEQIYHADSINRIAFSMFILLNAEPKFTSYENLINTNDLGLIRSNEIKLMMTEIEDLLNQRKQRTYWQNEQWLNINQPYINENLEFLEMSPVHVHDTFEIPVSRFANNWDRVLKDQQFRNLVFNRLLAADDVIEVQKKLMRKIEDGIKLVQIDLIENHNEDF